MSVKSAAIDTLAQSVGSTSAPCTCTCPELTGLQKVAGFVTWMNILQVLAICMGVFAVLVLLSPLALYLLSVFKVIPLALYLLSVFKVIPIEAYEVLGYLGSVGLISGAYFVSSSDNQLWMLLPGCLLFSGMMFSFPLLMKLLFKLLSIIMKKERKIEHLVTTLLMMIQFGLWSAVAIFYENSIIGFISVAALMSLLGFFSHSFLGGYVVGFKSKDALCNATTSALLIVSIFVVAKINQTRIPYLHVFEGGALHIGCFVGYLGLFIASNRWYPNANYAVMQVVTIVAGMLALGVGSIFDISELRGYGGTFFALYLLEKPFEVEHSSIVEFALKTLFVAGMLGTSVWWAQNNMEIVEPYLLF